MCMKCLLDELSKDETSGITELAADKSVLNMKPAELFEKLVSTMPSKPEDIEYANLLLSDWIVDGKLIFFHIDMERKEAHPIRLSKSVAMVMRDFLTFKLEGDAKIEHDTMIDVVTKIMDKAKAKADTETKQSKPKHGYVN